MSLDLNFSFLTNQYKNDKRNLIKLYISDVSKKNLSENKNIYTTKNIKKTLVYPNINNNKNKDRQNYYSYISYPESKYHSISKFKLYKNKIKNKSFSFLPLSENKDYNKYINCFQNKIFIKKKFYLNLNIFQYIKNPFLKSYKKEIGKDNIKNSIYKQISKTQSKNIINLNQIKIKN